LKTLALLRTVYFFSLVLLSPFPVDQEPALILFLRLPSLLCCVSILSSRLLCGNSSKAGEEPRLSIGLALDRREVQMFPAQCICCSSTGENQAVLFLKTLRCTTETAAVPALQKSFASCLSHIDLRSSREICTPIW
jgi:hypothetical protein